MSDDQKMTPEIMAVIEREATRTAWIGMLLFFACAILTIAGIHVAAIGTLMFLLVWVGSGTIAVMARR